MPLNHTVSEQFQPFIGYLSAKGVFESYNHAQARDRDYHHSFIVRDLDAYSAEETTTFVRMNGGNDFSIRGSALMDPFDIKSTKVIGHLCIKLIGRGADPRSCLIVEDMGFARRDAPWQGKNLGTLSLWAGKRLDHQCSQTPPGARLREWFQDSVVTKSGRPGGEPLVVYHGTNRDFRSFDTRPRGGHLGAYFTRDPEYANVLSRAASPLPRFFTGAQVMPVYLCLTQPAGREELSGAIADYCETGAQIRDWLESRGFNGLVMHDDIVAFYPWQIKSALGNPGSFNLAESTLDDREINSEEAASRVGSIAEPEGAGFELR